MYCILTKSVDEFINVLYSHFLREALKKEQQRGKKREVDYSLINGVVNSLFVLLSTAEIRSVKECLCAVSWQYSSNILQGAFSTCAVIISLARKWAT